MMEKGKQTADTPRYGKPPVPLWIDGIRYASTALAKAELHVTSKNAQAFKQALNGTGLFEGHIVSRHPFREAASRISLVRRRVGEPLLSDSCVHRLGVYRGGSW
jgi:hypothetical protein